MISKNKKYIIIITIILLIVLYFFVIKKKESFKLPSDYITDPSQLNPATHYLIGTLNSSKKAETTAASGGGKTCTQQGKDFPLIVYKNADATCADASTNQDSNYIFSTVPQIGSDIGSHFTKLIFSGVTAPTTTPNIYNTSFVYSPNGTILLSRLAYHPSPATAYIYFSDITAKGQTNLGTLQKFVNGVYSAIINPSTYVVGGIESNSAYYNYKTPIGLPQFNPSQPITTVLGQVATKMLVGSVAKTPSAAVGQLDLNTFAILQQDTGGNTVGTLSSVSSQKFIFSRFNYNTTWQTLPLPTSNIVTSWGLDTSPMGTSETPVAIFSILIYKAGASSVMYYIDLLQYIPVTNNVLGLLNVTDMVNGWKKISLPINPTTNAPMIFSEFSIGRNLRGFGIEETTGDLYTCSNVSNASTNWTKVIIKGNVKLKKINYIVNDFDMILASDKDDNLYIDYSASKMSM
jgi:hypothetical protein